MYLTVAWGRDPVKPYGAAVLLTPCYDDPSLLRWRAGPADPTPLVVAQRERLGESLAGLAPEQWASPSRCEGWTVQDVVAHLATVNQFWTFSVGAAVGGAPSRLLAEFDPVATPDALVAASRGDAPAAVLDRYQASCAELASALAAVDDWDALGEAPPGHLPLRAVALHALWDAWVHERDVLLPLGLDPVEDPAEVAASLAYAACLGPLFAVVMGGDRRRGVLGVRAADPDVALVLEVGDGVVVRDGEGPAGAAVLTGPAAALLEGLSRRAPLPCPVPDADAWLVEGLATVFDQI